MPQDSNAGEYFIEFLVIGEQVKVTAVDTQSLREVSLVGSARYSRDMLARQAVKKLRYVLAKEAGNGNT
ncbi:MAG: hypothetical protein EBX37_10425 [Alphaproteobacteria bacterium]|nr:hypothetical protein [Alphaproteobacteria bacterium]